MHLIAFWALTLAPETYPQARAELDETVDSARDLGPAEAAEALASVVEGIEAYPEKLAADPEMLARRDFALMALAFSHFGAGELEQASSVIDEAIRSARERKLPHARFGPEFKALYNERVQHAQGKGRAQISVDCDDCQVFINEQQAPEKLSLYLGSYRVWTVRGDERSFDTLELSEPGVLITLPPDDDPPPPVLTDNTNGSKDSQREAPPPPSKDTTSEPPSRHQHRMLPRWASATGAAVGAALMITGGIIFSYNGKCPDGLDPVLDRPECPNVYNAKPTGYSLLLGGAALFTSFGVVLSLDEIRARRGRAPSLALSYTLRF